METPEERLVKARTKQTNIDNARALVMLLVDINELTSSQTPSEEFKNEMKETIEDKIKQIFTSL